MRKREREREREREFMGIREEEPTEESQGREKKILIWGERATKKIKN